MTDDLLTSTSGVRRYDKEDEPQTALRDMRSTCTILAGVTGGLGAVMIATAVGSFATGEGKALWWLFELGLVLAIVAGGFTLAAAGGRFARLIIQQQATSIHMLRDEVRELHADLVDLREEVDGLGAQVARVERRQTEAMAVDLAAHRQRHLQS